MTGLRFRRAVGLAAAPVALLAALALGACGSDQAANTGGRTSGGGQIGHRMSATIAPQIDPRPQTFISADVLSPVTNAWRTASHTRLTEVDAGALAADRSTGALAIFRHDFLTVRQEMNVVEVKDAGPLRITKAPLGRGGEASAQQSGRIEFAGAHGVRGTLYLKDDTVALRDD